MVWVKIDDQYGEHPKIVMAGPIAAAIHVRSMCYSNRYLTDGFLPDDAVPSMVAGINAYLEKLGVPPEKRNIDWPGILVKEKLWERVEGGYLVHDFLDYNPSREKVLAQKKQKEKAGKTGAESRWHGVKPDGKTDSKPIAEAIAPAIPSAIEPLSENLCPRPDPHPDPGKEINKRYLTDHDTKTANSMPDPDIPPDFSKEKSDMDTIPPPPELPPEPPPPPTRQILIPVDIQPVVKACRQKITNRIGHITDEDVYLLIAGQNGNEGFGTARRLMFAVERLKKPIDKPVAMLFSFLKEPAKYLNDTEYDNWKRLRGS